MEKFLENLIEAEKTLQSADHIVYVTFSIIKDKRLLLKVLQEIKNVVLLCINSILQYEYMYKRVTLYKDSKSNFRTFIDNCSKRYGIEKEELNLVFELFELVDSHKKSPFEFIKEDKIVILSSSMQPKILTLEKTKDFLVMAKNLLKKTKEGFKSNSYGLSE